MSKCVVITGGSSGIGRELAILCAEQGVTLGLIGRNEQRLHETAFVCRGKGASVSIGILDVRKREDVDAWLVAFDSRTPVDLVIANAGVTGGAREGEDIEADETSRLVFETNLMGVLNTVQPLLPHMIARRSGQLALVSSLAGFIPLPDAPSYGASKAAVLRYGLALRTALRGSGVKLSVICPGFVVHFAPRQTAAGDDQWRIRASAFAVRCGSRPKASRKPWAIAIAARAARGRAGR